MAEAIAWKYVGEPSDEEIQRAIQIVLNAPIEQPEEAMDKEEEDQLEEVYLILIAHTLFQIHKGTPPQAMTDFFLEKGIDSSIVRFIVSGATIFMLKKIARFKYAAHAVSATYGSMPRAFFSEDNLLAFLMASGQRNTRHMAKLSSEGIQVSQIQEGLMWYQAPPELDVTHELPGWERWEVSVDKLNFYADAFFTILTHANRFIGDGLSPKKAIKHLIEGGVPEDFAEKLVKHVLPKMPEEYRRLGNSGKNKKKSEDILVISVVIVVILAIIMICILT